MSDVTISSVDFKNFKALGNYSLSMQRMNILVGPNNCGKSTIISAFRALSSAIKKARAYSPELVEGPMGDCFGYYITEAMLPLSIENVHSDYEDKDTSIIFRLSNKNTLQFYFPKDGGCVFIPESERKAIRRPLDFIKEFPITIGVVPVLGPVEHEEEIKGEETVKRFLATHRASRHFRSYWRYFPEGFDDFAVLIKKTWPGMEIKFPEKVDILSGKLVMFCLEGRIDREIYWTGFGFQIWCQLLTHISRSQNDSIIVIDEPEIYLHPDVQRQLLGILRDTGPDILIATHSTEIMGEADPSEILLIDKTKRSAKRLKDVKGVQEALDIVGSVQNITLTQLARNKRLLFVEGISDFTLLRKFARKIGLTGLSNSVGITSEESGGFSSWEKIKAVAWGFEKAIGNIFQIGAIFDRDYFATEEIDSIYAELGPHLKFLHIHDRKEIENYLLIPDILEKALQKSILEEERRTGRKISINKTIIELLEEITGPLKISVQAQFISKRGDFLRSTGKDSSTIAEETMRLFESKWKQLETRLDIVPGKTVLSELREKLQKQYHISLTNHKIVSEFKESQVPADLRELLIKLDEFRNKETPGK